MEKLVTRLTARTVVDDTGADLLSQARFDREQSRLSNSFTGDDTTLLVTEPPFIWWQAFVESRARGVRNDLLAKVLCDFDEKSGPLSLEEKTKLFAVTGKIIDAIRTSPDASIEDVADALETHDDCLQKDGLPRLLQEDARDLTVHLVFHIVGWITGLWDPVLDKNLTCFRVADDQSKSRRRSLLHTPAVRKLSVRLVDQGIPIYRLLTRIGDLFPNQDSLLSEQDIGQVDIESACITAAYVSFHNLENVLNIKLQWTNVLNQHLEYDRRRNVLHVFSAPSICDLSLRLGSESVLAKLFEQYRTGREMEDQFADFGVYLTEIILSYRLIFGWHKKSRKLVRALLPTEKTDDRYSSKVDPLLESLCTKDSKSAEIQALLSELGVDDITNYVSLEEFQFLGKRLLRLERISKSQNPSRIWALWNDRRNSMAWFSIWAVLLLGGGTLIFQMLQFVFQIYQPLG